MNITHIRTTIVAIATAALTLAGTQAATAKSTMDQGDCPSGKFCLWVGYNFEGQPDVGRAEYEENLGKYGFDQEASSLYNNTGYVWYVFDQDYCDGQAAGIAPGDSSPDLHVHGWDDAIQSIAREDKLDSCQNS